MNLQDLKEATKNIDAELYKLTIAYKWLKETIKHFESCTEKDNCRTVWDFRLFLDENDIEFVDPFEGK